MGDRSRPRLPAPSNGLDPGNWLSIQAPARWSRLPAHRAVGRRKAFIAGERLSRYARAMRVAGAVLR
jgi:hypothetical protein